MAKKTSKKSPSKSTEKTADTSTLTRVRKAPTYKSFRLQKRIKHPKGSPIGVRRLLERTFRLLWEIKKPLAGVLVVFAFLNIIFVQGFNAPINVAELRVDIENALGENVDRTTQNLTIFGELISGRSDTSVESAGLYRNLMLLFLSLALVWMFRQHTAGNKVTTKAAIYRSTYPLVPTLLVLLVIGLQLLPFAVAASIFSVVVENGIAANGFETAVWILLLILSGLLSFYLTSSSVFALYIVTLPEMTPMKALRSARQLVRHRRFVVMRRLLVLPIIMFIILAGLLLPAIFFAEVIAPWLYFVLGLLGLPFLHAYVYSLYRELL